MSRIEQTYETLATLIAAADRDALWSALYDVGFLCEVDDENLTADEIRDMALDYYGGAERGAMEDVIDRLEKIVS